MMSFIAATYVISCRHKLHANFHAESCKIPKLSSFCKSKIETGQAFSEFTVPEILEVSNTGNALTHGMSGVQINNTGKA